MPLTCWQGGDKKCLAAGCDDFIGKPLDRDRLLDVIGNYLQARELAVCPGPSEEA
ncbi:MAG TPA: hypothetical protein VJJ98_08610 [Sedimentisphaerales bacterium]|nr:hypothetical protein [Sedimentisphaerales bacterium]